MINVNPGGIVQVDKYHNICCYRSDTSFFRYLAGFHLFLRRNCIVGPTEAGLKGNVL